MYHGISSIYGILIVVERAQVKVDFKEKYNWSKFNLIHKFDQELDNIVLSILRVRNDITSEKFIEYMSLHNIVTSEQFYHLCTCKVRSDHILGLPLVC